MTHEPHGRRNAHLDEQLRPKPLRGTGYLKPTGEALADLERRVREHAARVKAEEKAYARQVKATLKRAAKNPRLMAEVRRAVQKKEMAERQKQKGNR